MELWSATLGMAVVRACCTQAEGIEALVILVLVLRDHSVLPDHLLDHAVEYFHL